MTPPSLQRGAQATEGGVEGRGSPSLCPCSWHGQGPGAPLRLPVRGGCSRGRMEQDGRVGAAGGTLAALVLARLLAAQLGKSRPAVLHCQAVPAAGGAVLRIRHLNSFPAWARVREGHEPASNALARGHRAQLPPGRAGAGGGRLRGLGAGFIVWLGVGAARQDRPLGPCSPLAGLSVRFAGSRVCGGGGRLCARPGAQAPPLSLGPCWQAAGSASWRPASSQCRRCLLPAWSHKEWQLVGHI